MDCVEKEPLSLNKWLSKA